MVFTIGSIDAKIKQMTILFFSRLFYPHIGGVEKHVMELSKRLIKKGYRVVVITENYGWKEKEIVNGIEIIRITVGKNEKLKKFIVWRKLWKYRKLISQADIVHSHDIFFWYLPFGYLQPTKPAYITFHGYEGNTVPGMREVIMHKIGEFSSDRNICIGDFLTKWYHTHATIVSYGATDIPNKIIIKKLDITPTFLYIGRLEEEAGILVYINALRILKRQGLVSKLIVLGDGTQRKEAERVTKEYGLNIEFKGFVENVNLYFSKADYVFVSRYLGILEAFAHKKFVFATYNNSIKKDYLSMAPFASWIAIVKSTEELADKIKQVLGNKTEKNECIKKSYDWVKNQTWDNLTNEYLKLWKII